MSSDNCNFIDKFKEIKSKLNLRITRNQNLLKLNFNLSKVSTLPSKFSLRDKMGEPFDQGSLGSCSSQSSLKVYQYHNPDFQPSRLYQYQQELIYDSGNVITYDKLTDNGSTMETAFRTLKERNVCSEKNWPYDISKFNTEPSILCHNEALLNRSLKDGIVNQNLDDIKMCLASPDHQNPISFGVLLFDSFENEETFKTGYVKTPNFVFQNLCGGHALVISGYNDETRYFEIINSWGNAVGDNGYFYFPYDYILNPMLTSDFHTLYKTTNDTHNHDLLMPSVPIPPSITPKIEILEEKENKPKFCTPKLNFDNINKPKNLNNINKSQTHRFSNSSSSSSSPHIPISSSITSSLNKAPSIPKLDPSVISKERK